MPTDRTFESVQALDMREHIRESSLIEGIDDPAEVDQSLLAWDWLSTRSGLDHEVVCRVQAIICANQTLADADGEPVSFEWKGCYRSVPRKNVRVGSHVAPDWSQVDDLMAGWLAELDDYDPWTNHVKFETVHPFRDGNGRSGRMLMWWDEIRRGQTPTLIKARDRQNYYHALSAGRPLDRDAYVHHLMALLGDDDDLPLGWSTKGYRRHGRG